MTKNNKRPNAMQEIATTYLFGGAGNFYAAPGANREAAIERQLQVDLTNMALGRFAWENLPETVEERFLEALLLTAGLAVFYWDKDYETHLAVRGSGNGYTNMLDNPVSFNVIGPGGGQMPVVDTDPALFHNKTLGAYQPMVAKKLGDEYNAKEKCVPIWNNRTRTPDAINIAIYAKRLAWIDRTLEINTRNARRNKVIKGSPNTQLSMVNFARQIDEGNELLQVTGALEDMQFIEALDLGIQPDAYEKLGVHRTRVWNECMIRLGIDSANQEKKERMVEAEVSANDAQADSVRIALLKARRDAVEHINEIWGLNIKVDFQLEVEAKEKAEDAAKLDQQQKPMELQQVTNEKKAIES